MSKKLQIKSVLFKQLYSLLTVVLYGWFFFDKCIQDNIPLYYIPIAFIIMWQTLFVIFNILLSNKYYKIISSILLLLNTSAFYFMYTYNIAVDKVMIMNLLQTDSNEAAELLNIKMLYFVIFFGIFPIILINKIEIVRCRFKYNIIRIFISLCCIAIIGGLAYKDTDYFLHRYKYLQKYLPPINYITAGAELLKDQLTPRPPLQKISQDISPLPVEKKPNLFIFIVGESSRAASFSLNGYHRPTNEALSPYLNEIVYYPNTQTCGTSTAVSVPCMFLAQDRKNYRTGIEEYTENVLDIFKKAGYKILWIDNDGGCKHVCDRVKYEEPCDKKTCLDDILLNNLHDKIEKNKDHNQLIVLHTRGSHGPLYNSYYDDESNIYSPICTKNILWECSREELINVYDNTVHYVSKFIAKTIDILKSFENKYNTAMIYTSDHGESLGEDNIYLHSAPYNTAPKYQTEVPMLVWLPQNNTQNINHSCLRKYTNQHHSHDNIFHSMLGLGGISSQYYQQSLDIFSNCKE